MASAPTDHALRQPDPRARDLAGHLREIVAAREARRAELVRAGAGASGHAFGTARTSGDPELASLDDRLHRALADAEDQCHRRFHDAFQAITALEQLTVAPRTIRAAWDDLVDLAVPAPRAAASR